MAYISVIPDYENYFDAGGGEVTIYAVLYGFDMSTLEYGWDRNHYDNNYYSNNKEFKIWGLTTYNDNPALEIKLEASPTSNLWRDVGSANLYVWDGSGNEGYEKISIIQNGIKTDPVIEYTPSKIDFKYNGGFQDVQVSYINFETIDEPYWGDWGNPDKFGFTTLSSNTTTSGNDTITTTTYRIYANETVDKKYASLIFIGTDMIGRETTRSLSINQKRKANPSSIEPSVNNFHFSTSATTGSFKVIYKDTSSTSNINTPTTTVSWFRITSTSTQYSDFDIIRTYRYSVTKNTSALDRTGTITFSSIGDDEVERSYTIDLLQDGVAEYDGGVHDNYVGYFKSMDGASYTVKMITDNSSSDWGILNMDAEAPFIVSYNVSNTPFEPLRTSTATISVVHNKYLDELYSPYAKGTSVEVYRTNKDKADDCVWCGYLVPKTYNQGYSSHYETIELEAADCISVLQYIDYELLNEGGCVTFKEIIDRILDETHITTYYWPHSKQSLYGFITPSDLGIFEKNFFENDTEDPWNLQDVMFEMCQYLGVTLLQWGDALYFVDYTALSQGDDRYYMYTKSQTRTVQGSDAYISNAIQMSSELSRGNDADISFEPIFNKVCVKDNFYNVEELIPNVFDDAYLTNRGGEFYTAHKITVPSPAKAQYVSNIRKTRDDVWKSEETADDKYTYFMRLFDHKYFESYYEEYPYSDFTPGTMSEPTDLIGRLGATIVDLAAVDESTFYGEYFLGEENGVPVGTVDYANKLDYKRYLCICENHEDGTVWDSNSNANRLVMRTPDMKFPCQITEDSYLVFNYSVTKTRYANRPYINPDWCKTGASGTDKYTEGSGHWGMYQWVQGPTFRFIVGDKAWDGTKWVDKNGKIEKTRFGCSLLKNPPAKDFWNEELKIPNRVTYDMNINESGYAIPLSGISQDDVFHIEILCPQVSFYAHKKLDLFEDTEFESHNAFTWLSDFSIKLCEKGQDIEKLDNDVVYENVIDEDSVNEFGELTFKMTTWHPNIKPSYSNVVTWVNGKRVVLTAIKEANLMNNPQTPEENAIERYVLQYKTPTKKISHSLPVEGITPFDKMYGLDVEKPNASFMQLGTEIDYSMGIQKITYIQCK